MERDKELKAALTKLAEEKPELRKHLIPILRTAGVSEAMWPFVRWNNGYVWRLGSVVYYIEPFSRNRTNAIGGTLYEGLNRRDTDTIATDNWHLWKLIWAAFAHAVRHHPGEVEKLKEADRYFALRFEQELKTTLRPDTIVHMAADKKETFEEYVEGKTFPSPKTGKKIKFDSLPPETQKKIREHWEEAGSRGSDEDKDFGASHLLADYNLNIVGKDKKRAAYVAKKVQEGIDKNADMCKVDPPTCEGNLGIGRDNMPQIMNKSVKQLLNSSKEDERKKGQAAVDAGADPKSDKSIQDIMLDDLQKEGVKIKKNVKIPVGKLKATQKEIKAGKSFGMADAYYKGEFDPAEGEVILVSSDNHILDGHHRWAALLLADPDREMKVIQIDMPMRELLRRSMKQPGVYRADLQDNVIPADTPLDLNEKSEDKKETAKSDKKEKQDTPKKPEKKASVDRVVRRYLFSH